MAIEWAGSATGSAAPLWKFWDTCVGAGRANEGPRAGWLEKLNLVVAECGSRYVRFHGLSHDDMFVYRENERGDPFTTFNTSTICSTACSTRVSGRL